MKRILLTSALLLTSSIAMAKPSAENIKEVLDFYYNGQGQGTVLVESKLCSDIVREGEQKNECTEVISGDVTVNQPFYVWMLYLVPQGDKISNMLLQANYKGLTRQTQSFGISGSIRYRTWKKMTLNKAGKWELKVIDDSGDDIEVIKTFDVNAVEAAQ